MAAVTGEQPAEGRPTWVVALGGNAIQRPGARGTYAEQMESVRGTARVLASIIGSGRARVVITHGNGPQVGAILLQNELAARQVPPLPLDACGAESQGLLGYLLSQALTAAFGPSGPQVVTVLTRVRVNPADPAFAQPEKPIGPYYGDAEAEEGRRRGWVMRHDAARGGWRRVVASPQPAAILELAAIRTLLDQGFVVVAAGGGGVPVIQEGRELVGAEAVIDKDLASALLADALDADGLFILTDVEAVAVDFGRPDQRFLGEVSLQELARHHKEGQFGSGSMGPKVEAILRFVGAGRPGRLGAIGALAAAHDVLAGRAGTRVRRGGDGAAGRGVPR
ncbi:MAG TPA: carbamate kinase [Bacillota bacterium]